MLSIAPQFSPLPVFYLTCSHASLSFVSCLASVGTGSYESFFHCWSHSCLPAPFPRHCKWQRGWQRSVTYIVCPLQSGTFHWKWGKRFTCSSSQHCHWMEWWYHKNKMMTVWKQLATRGRKCKIVRVLDTETNYSRRQHTWGFLNIWASKRRRWGLSLVVQWLKILLPT